MKSKVVLKPGDRIGTVVPWSKQSTNVGKTGLHISITTIKNYFNFLKVVRNQNNKEGFSNTLLILAVMRVLGVDGLIESSNTALRNGYKRILSKDQKTGARTWIRFEPEMDGDKVVKVK